MTTRETAPSVARAPAGAPAAASPSAPSPTSARPATTRGGGYYLNDGPGDNPPANIDQIPDAVPRAESLRPANMRPYTVMGQTYTPMTRLAPYKERGIASWYGRRYHDQKTSSGEIYDMYGMTAAHTILPIPSYARVTNLANNKSIIVRINDRGPFHSDRMIDLSYTAAYKLGVLGGGRAMVEVETLLVDAGTPVVPAAIATAPPAPPSAPPVAVALAPEAATLSASAEPAAALTDKPAPAVPVVTEAAVQKGLFLQLGAFGSQDNADTYLARLREHVDWLAPALHVYPKDGLYRVHAGPYPNQTDARAAADRISQALGIKPMVLTR
ncbi:MAG: septal ring lytic transglycosylase RlpA family protein [Burkholderiales bacterium]